VFSDRGGHHHSPPASNRATDVQGYFSTASRTYFQARPLAFILDQCPDTSSVGCRVDLVEVHGMGVDELGNEAPQDPQSHAYFRPITRQQERRIEEARAFSSTPLHRSEESREEVLKVVRGCGPPRATELSRTSVPPAVPNTPLQDDRLAWLGVARLLGRELKPKPARHNGHALVLKMVQMHRRTDTRRSKEFALHAIAVSITNDAQESEYWPWPFSILCG
jgi:hypothetical protein